MKQWKCLKFLMIAMLLVSNLAYAIEDPINMLKRVTDEVMIKINENRESYKRHPSEMYTMVNTIILPHVDFVEMAKWVLGRNAWRNASEATRNAFIKEFKTLVVRSYAHSILEYADYKINFLPYRGSIEDHKRLEISSHLKGDGQTVNMEYRILREGNTWKVYDIIFENVSLVQGYRAQFAEDIQRDGVAAVVKTIRLKNTRSMGQ